MEWNYLYTSGIQRYITSAQPSTLMFDVYPIRAGVIANQSEGYENALLHQYENLREVCTYANSVYPNNWYFVGQGFGDYSTNPRLPTPAEFNGHSMLALAHGTRGLIYYKYYGGIDQGLTTTFLSLANRLKSTLGNKLLELSYSGNSIRLHWGTYEGTVSTVTQQYLTLTRPDVYTTYGSFHSSFLDYSSDPNAKYFMLVNELTMSGHAQNINVTVNRPNQNFNNWCWKNIEGGFEETVTDATTKSFTIPLGEGYLYQLAPVIKYGGKIKTNETISGTNTLSGEMTVESGATLTINGTYNVNQNITVNSGGSLVINPGAIITFSAGKKLKIYGGGSLTANGATFQGNGIPGYWNSISFYANSSGSIQNSTIKNAQAGIYTTTNANVTVSGCTITNNSLYGLSVLQNSNVTISNCTISNNGTGINTTSSIINITGNNIINNTNYGINANTISNSLYWHDNVLQGNGYAMLLNNASPYVYNNSISDNDHGVVITSSLPNFANPSNQWGGYNAITCASTPLFKAENYSTVYMGYGYDGGFNSIFGSDLPDMLSLNHSGIYADNNYWGSPNPQIYADGTSWILARTPLGSDPNPGSECGGYLVSSSLASNSSYVEGDISYKYWEAISQGRAGNLQKANELLQLIIEGKFDEKYSPLALLTLYEFSVNDKNGLNSKLMEIYNRAKDDLLRPFAIRLLARESALSNNNKEMISYNTELINNYTNSVNELTALYDLVVYNSEIEQDVEKAKGFFLRLKEAYPKEDLTLFAEINLGFMTKGDLKKETTDDKIPDIYYLSAAFPNPFNPTTKISYQLPKDAHVTLKVYDLLGREVATLVNEEKQAGVYETQFNASELSSGIYLYKITMNDFTKTMKMMVVK